MRQKNERRAMDHPGSYPVTVICLVSYDIERLFESLESYYDYADEIIFGLEARSLSMTMQPIEVPPVFFERVKAYPKVRIVQDEFYASSRTSVENDTHQRNELSLHAKGGNWIAQIDSDEVLLNPQDFFPWLCEQPRELAIQATWVSLFKELDDRYMVVCERDGRTINRERWPVATAKKYACITARSTGQRARLSPLWALHYSWARTEDAVVRKANNWGHSSEIDRERTITMWRELTTANYRSYRNFHPLSPRLWPRLAYLSKEEILEQVQRYVQAQPRQRERPRRTQAPQLARREPLIQTVNDRHGPLVSVIIPTHNRPHFLRRAIQSVVDQTYTDWELVVVQNGGTRESEAVVKPFQGAGAPIQYHYEPTANPVHARNVGIRLSKGRYIAFLDDDDEWLPTKLERQVALLEQIPGVGLVYCRAWLVDEGGTIIGEAKDYKGEPTFQVFVREWGRVIRSLSAVVVRRVCFDRVGVFEPAYQIANDYEFYLRLARWYRCVALAEPLFRYRRHCGQQGNLSAKAEQAITEGINVLRRLQPAEQLGVTRHMIRDLIAKFYHLLAVEDFDARRFVQAALQFLAAVSYDPLVGMQVSWTRSRHPLYRILRPYGAALFCLCQSVLLRSWSLSRCASDGDSSWDGRRSWSH